jgi:cell division protein FtsB
VSTPRNTQAIVQLAADKREKARQRVREAIQTLEQGVLPINFNTVAKQARVSKTFLYDPRPADLAAEIRRLRDPLRQQPARPPASRGKSDTAKEAQFARLQERVRDLEQEVRELRRENELLYDKLAERVG